MQRLSIPVPVVAVAAAGAVLLAAYSVRDQPTKTVTKPVTHVVTKTVTQTKTKSVIVHAGLSTDCKKAITLLTSLNDMVGDNADLQSAMEDDLEKYQTAVAIGNGVDAAKYSQAVSDLQIKYGGDASDLGDKLQTLDTYLKGCK